MRLSPVSRFFWHALLWLPACFALWYLSAAYWLFPIWAGLDTLMPKLLPSLVDGVERLGRVMEVVTRVKPSGEAAAYRGAVLSFEVNPLVYAYSLPLYAGLTLAAPTRPTWRKLRNLGIGLPLLLPFVFWGACFEIYKTLAFSLAADTSAYADFSGWRREAIVWGYQFGFLVLPGVMPLAIWLALHRDFLNELAPVMAPR